MGMAKAACSEKKQVPQPQTAMEGLQNTGSDEDSCFGCGYDLRKLEVSNFCPNCGQKRATEALKKKKEANVAVAPEAEEAEVLSPKTKKDKKRKLEEQASASEEQENEASDSKKARKDADGLMDPAEFRKTMQITSKTCEHLPDPVQSFSSAPFPKKLRTALKNAGFPAPTAIQAQGWPVAMQGNDLVAVAKTGSGKTLAFLLPAFSKIVKEQPEPADGPPVLVLAPTRELAVQIEEAAAKFATSVDIRTVVIYGGAPKQPQAKALRNKPHVLVATPGRLVDFMNDGTAKLTSTQLLVLDEADRMLDMGFEPQMEAIMKQVPEARQTLLFTATWPKAVQKLASKYIRKDGVHINVGETDELAANKAVSQEFFKLDDDEKEAKLWTIIGSMDDNSKLLVFANTKRRITQLEKIMWNQGYDCVAMHGDKSQHERDEGLAKFVSGKVPLLLATDVCARGLDIKSISHVVNYDMARDVESYIHRIGRTGRAGASGVSITFFNEAYDMACAPALAKIAREAGQTVPPFLEKAASKSEQQKLKNKQWKY